MHSIYKIFRKLSSKGFFKRGKVIFHGILKVLLLVTICILLHMVAFTSFSGGVFGLYVLWSCLSVWLDLLRDPSQSVCIEYGFAKALQTLSISIVGLTISQYIGGIVHSKRNTLRLTNTLLYCFSFNIFLVLLPIRLGFLMVAIGSVMSIIDQIFCYFNLGFFCSENGFGEIFRHLFISVVMFFILSWIFNKIQIFQSKEEIKLKKIKRMLKIFENC